MTRLVGLMLLSGLCAHVTGAFCLQASYKADVAVYGGTAAGCVAAIAASRSGADRVVLVMPEHHVGGMTTGGIMHADSANTSTVGGITLEFFHRVLSYYNSSSMYPDGSGQQHKHRPAQSRQHSREVPPIQLAKVPDLNPGSPHQVGDPWLYESHVAEQVLEAMLAEANVSVFRDLKAIAQVDMRNGTWINTVTMYTGLQVTATVWIDASYEGDLAFAAGTTMTWGREATATYNESFAGRQPASLTFDVSPFWPDGSLIPHVSNASLVPVGGGDERVEAYDFRLCITNSPGHHIPFSKPAGYNASNYEFWRRLYNNGTTPPKTLAEAGLGCLGPVPNTYNDCGAVPCQKCDMLGMVHSTDLYNGAWAYPNATFTERQLIRQAHVDYTLGLLWFWATDPASGQALHEQMASVGFCDDEYVDSTPPYFPYQLYVREARRLVGDFVWTVHDPPAQTQAHSIGVGAYTFDCHWVSLYASGSKVEAEGRVNLDHNGRPTSGVFQQPFVMPYEAMLPKRAEVTNLIVPVACSASHVRFNAIRMEPTWMILGHAAGTAAQLAAASGSYSPVHDVNITLLQNTLQEQHQKLFP